MGPFALAWEIVTFVSSAMGIEELTLEENVPKISYDRLARYQVFLDFYLHTALRGWSR